MPLPLSCDNVILVFFFLLSSSVFSFITCEWHFVFEHARANEHWMIWNAHIHVACSIRFEFLNFRTTQTKKIYLFWFETTNRIWRMKIFPCHNRILAEFWANCSIFFSRSWTSFANMVFKCSIVDSNALKHISIRSPIMFFLFSSTYCPYNPITMAVALFIPCADLYLNCSVFCSSHWKL